MTNTYNDVSKSIAQMVTEWVESGANLGVDWRPGLASIIEKRLERLLKRPEPDTSEIEIQRWNPNCEWKDRKGNCCNPDGCHCREIEDLQYRVKQLEACSRNALIKELMGALEYSSLKLEEISRKALHWERTFIHSDSSAARWRQVKAQAHACAVEARNALSKATEVMGDG